MVGKIERLKQMYFRSWRVNLRLFPVGYWLRAEEAPRGRPGRRGGAGGSRRHDEPPAVVGEGAAGERR